MRSPGPGRGECGCELVSESAACCPVALVRVFGLEVDGVGSVGGLVEEVAEVPCLAGEDRVITFAAGPLGEGGVVAFPDELEDGGEVGADLHPLSAAACDHIP